MMAEIIRFMRQPMLRKTEFNLSPLVSEANLRDLFRTDPAGSLRSPAGLAGISYAAAKRSFFFLTATFAFHGLAIWHATDAATKLTKPISRGAASAEEQQRIRQKPTAISEITEKRFERSRSVAFTSVAQGTSSRNS